MGGSDATKHSTKRNLIIPSTFSTHKGMSKLLMQVVKDRVVKGNPIQESLVARIDEELIGVRNINSLISKHDVRTLSS